MISMIVAIAHNRVIGKNNILPWRIPEDLKWFKDNTINKPVIMGRKTHESIGKILKNRDNLILTTNKNYKSPYGATGIYTDLDHAFIDCGDAEEVMIIGGAQIYKELMPGAKRLYITRIDEFIDGDAFFPEIDNSWKMVYNREGKDNTQFKYSFNIFERSF